MIRLHGRKSQSNQIAARDLVPRRVTLRGRVQIALGEI